MGLARLARRYFDQRERLDPTALRSSKPLRNPEVTQEPGDDGAIVLSAPLALQGRGVLSAMARMMNAPDRKKFELEEVGAFVWNLCDGKHTFEGISKGLREQFKMNRLDADASLIAFLQMLSQRRLVTLLVAKEK